MSAYEKVKSGKLSFKSDGASVGDKAIAKKKKRKKKTKTNPEAEAEAAGDEAAAAPAPAEAGQSLKSEEVYEIDTGIGHAPDGKKSKKYEELFPVENKRFKVPTVRKDQTREDALDERVKKKADRYCK